MVAAAAVSPPSAAGSSPRAPLPGVPLAARSPVASEPLAGRRLLLCPRARQPSPGREQVCGGGGGGGGHPAPLLPSRPSFPAGPSGLPAGPARHPGRCPLALGGTGTAARPGEGGLGLTATAVGAAKALV